MEQYTWNKIDSFSLGLPNEYQNDESKSVEVKTSEGETFLAFCCFSYGRAVGWYYSSSRKRIPANMVISYWRPLDCQSNPNLEDTLTMEDRLHIRCEAYEAQIKSKDKQLLANEVIINSLKNYERERTIKITDLVKNVNSLVNAINGTSTNNMVTSDEEIGKAVTTAMDQRVKYDRAVEHATDMESRYYEVLTKLMNLTDKMYDLEKDSRYNGK